MIRKCIIIPLLVPLFAVGVCCAFLITVLSNMLPEDSWPYV